ncbi:MAG: hypothetical protein ACI8W7_000410, partial [Gammaproteobacteria bacterium]
ASHYFARKLLRFLISPSFSPINTHHGVAGCATQKTPFPADLLRSPWMAKVPNDCSEQSWPPSTMGIISRWPPMRVWQSHTRATTGNQAAAGRRTAPPLQKATP